jgi:uncharacterized protein YjdB
MLYKLFLPFFVISICLTISACDNDDNERKLTELQVTATQNPVPSGYQSQLTATAFYSDNTSYNIDATWESMDVNIATVDLHNGLVSTVSPGDVTIQATASGVTGIIGLTVTGATLQSIQLSPEIAETPLGLEVQYDVTGSFSDGSSHDISSEPGLQVVSSDENVAVIDLDTFESESRSVGSTEFTASLDGVESNVAHLAVNDLALQSITISPERVSWPLGLTQRFNAEARLSDGSTIDISSNVSWTSSSPEIVELVDDGGVFQGIALGTSSISASLDDFVSDNRAIFIVENRVLTSFTVTSATGADEVPVGKTVQFKALAEFSDGEIYDVSGFRQVHWQSSDPSVATVTLSGEVTGVSTGQVTISAYTAYADVNAQMRINVTEAEVEDIVVQPFDQNRIISESGTQQYDAFARYTDGSIDEDVEDDAAFSWSVETHIFGDPFTTPPDASVDANGLLTFIDTARFPGFGNVHGNYNSLSGVTSVMLPFAQLLVVTTTSPVLEFVGTLAASEADGLDVEYSRVVAEDLGFNEYYDYVIMNYDQATTFCDELLYNGHDDWRLPDTGELNQLWQFADGVDDVFVFSMGWVFSRTYWSSTAQVDGHDVVSLVDASVSTALDQSLHYASCVRSQ